MSVGEVFLSAFLQVLFDRLAPGDLSFFPRPGLVLAELRKWKKKLLKIEAVLADAEEKQLMDKLVKLWLDDLRDLAYDLEDLLDELATEELERKLMAGQRSILTDAGRALMFYTGMKSKMDDISNRLDRIWEEKDELGLIKKIARDGGTSISLHQRISSTCLPTELDVYGRDEDTAKILEMVLNDESTDANFRVISIIGMGGIGKTTLARKVYNDEALIDFYPKAWVCVSDDFDVLRISKAILESITGCSCDLKDLNAVQIQLKQKIAGMKFFLVLDDVWSKNYSSWEILRSPFLFGSPGSKIIVTTRHEDVALTMGRFIECCKLKLLSDDDCWFVFKKHAYEAEVTSAHRMGLMREKVVEKCKGLPLAAKILGGLIRSKQRDDEWLDLLNSKIWDLPDASEIPAALKLSYHYLPSNLKGCFAYCTVLPKDYEFEEDELVFLWIAEGLIQLSNENKQLEDLGHEYFHYLLLRSIFQQSTSNKSKYVMHDLISDLAQWVSGDTCFCMEGDAWGSKKQLSKIEKVRHFSFTCGDFDGKSKFQAFNEIEQVQRLRTFLPLSRINGGSNVHYISHMVIFDLLSKFKKLRVLCLKDYYVTELPESLGHLRHLRCLNLSGTKLKSLPESTSLLINLQILNLKDCSLLMKLPFEMRNLINLHYLDIRGTSLTEMPFGMKELRSLRKLSNFIVGKGMGGSYVKDLKDLKFLREELCISRLENASDSHEPREMILNDIKGLKVLQFEWGSLFDDTRNEVVEKNVLDMLRPHQNLEKLTVKFYGGIEFPSWLGNSNFFNMMVLRLENCEKCTSLPSLGTLGSLKDLTIKGMRGLKRIGSELCGEGFSKPFHLLESLHFEDLQEWENWKPNKDNENVDAFFCLRELSIVECPKLSGRLPGHLPSLEKLVVKNCEELVVSFSNISMVCELEIDRIKGMACDSKIDLKSLKSISLSNISEFGNWLRQEFPLIERLNLKNVGHEPLMHLCQLKPPQGLQRFTSLRKLCIENCSTIVSFPEVCFLYNLSELEIRNCTSLTSLLDEAMKHNNSCLEHLEIVRCDSLTVIVRGQLPSSIKRLIVRYCKKLQCLLDDRESTSLLEYLYVLNCPSLVWLSSGGQLPTTLKDLSVECCSQITALSSSGQLPEMLCTLSIMSNPMLESIAESFHNNTHLENIWISRCENLKSIPEGLHNLCRLRYIRIWNCPSIVCFPEGGLPNTNLSISIISCEKLKALPNRFHSLDSLQALEIRQCPSIKSFPDGGFPTNLTSLEVEDLNIHKPLVEWGLHKLTSLTVLEINGCPDAESFPQKELGMMLPPSLTRLSIKNFPKLKCLWFEGFGNRTSLEYLWIRDCPNLTSFPDSGLPSSLIYLYIRKCPSLKEQCKKNKGKEWSKISDTPCVYIDGRFIYSPEDEE